MGGHILGVLSFYNDKAAWPGGVPETDRASEPFEWWWVAGKMNRRGERVVHRMPYRMYGTGVHHPWRSDRYVLSRGISDHLPVGEMTAQGCLIPNSALQSWCQNHRIGQNPTELINLNRKAMHLIYNLIIQQLLH